MFSYKNTAAIPSADLHMKEQWCGTKWRKSVFVNGQPIVGDSDLKEELC